MSTENMEAPEIYSGKVGVEIVPDMRKLRSFAKDFIALVDSYWPETPGGVDEREQASQASWKDALPQRSSDDGPIRIEESCTRLSPRPMSMGNMSMTPLLSAR